MHFIRSRASVSNYKMHITKISTRFFLNRHFCTAHSCPRGPSIAFLQVQFSRECVRVWCEVCSVRGLILVRFENSFKVRVYTKRYENKAPLLFHFLNPVRARLLVNVWLEYFIVTHTLQPV